MLIRGRSGSVSLRPQKKLVPLGRLHTAKPNIASLNSGISMLYPATCGYLFSPRQRWITNGGRQHIGLFSTPDTQHYSVTMNNHLVDPASSYMLVSKIKPCMSKYIPLHPTSRSDPSQSVQYPATCVESILDALCNRGVSVDVASCVSRPQ